MWGGRRAEAEFGAPRLQHFRRDPGSAHLHSRYSAEVGSIERGLDDVPRLQLRRLHGVDCGWQSRCKMRTRLDRKSQFHLHKEEYGLYVRAKAPADRNLKDGGAGLQIVLQGKSCSS